MKVSETLEDFSHALIVTGSRLPRTIAKYEQILRRFIRLTGDKAIHELKVEDFGNIKFAMAKAEKKSSTVATTISVFCKYAIYLKKTHSVILDIEDIRMMRPKVQQTSPEALEKWQIVKLFEAAVDVEDCALVQLLFYTGVRIDELMNLEEAAIEERTTTQDENGAELTTTWIRVLGKGNKVRDIPLSVSAAQMLTRYLEYFKTKYPENVKKLFPHSYSTYWRRLHKLGEKAGIKVSPHVMRHTFGYTLTNKKVDIRRIADLMGHVDMNVTQRYAKVKEKAKIEAVNEL